MIDCAVFTTKLTVMQEAPMIDCAVFTTKLNEILLLLKFSLSARLVLLPSLTFSPFGVKIKLKLEEEKSEMRGR